ncbi:hypothetical protein K474DRAFT_1709410 [Panus rudis PR-1116 ss-1]|nr:hypothetical protein K474DRAFT_1709410 [Panus rudis PR-1116 ss-1]
MPTPGRFRSKTSDISDLLRGKQSTDSAPLPPLPPAEPAPTPTKARRTLAFLGRKMKSVSPSPSAVSAQSAPEDVPPLPEKPAGQIAAQSSSSAISSSLPSSLPPLNVSPPSFGFSHLSSSKNRTSDVTQTPDPGRPSELKPPYSLRAQKSTSFEFIGRNRTASTPKPPAARGGRPVITVSAPPQNAQNDDSETFVNAPRDAPVPPAPAPTRPRTLRKPLILPFSHHRREETQRQKQLQQQQSQPSQVQHEQQGKPSSQTTSPPSSKIPTPASPSPPALTPPLPPSMRFPLPPNPIQTRPSQDSSASLSKRSGAAVTNTNGDDPVPPSPLSESFSSDAASSVRTFRESGAEGLSSPASSSHLRLPDELSPTRQRFSTVSTGSNASFPSVVSMRGKQQQGGRTPQPPPPPLRLSMRRSRSPSPAGTPPTAPLPDLPPEAKFVPSPTRETFRSGPSSPISSPTSATTPVPRIPSMASMGSRRSVTSIPQPPKGVRSRSNTATSSIISQVVVSAGEQRSGNGKENRQSREFASGRPRQPSTSSSANGDPASSSQPPPHSSNPPPSRHVRNKLDKSLIEQHLGINPPTNESTTTATLQARHESYVRTLKEMHAAEKAELVKRIEQLEREARKREREIKGLRWLVLNAPAAALNDHNHGVEGAEGVEGVEGVDHAVGVLGPEARLRQLRSLAEAKGRVRVAGASKNSFGSNGDTPTASGSSGSGSGSASNGRRIANPNPNTGQLPIQDSPPSFLALVNSPRSSTEEGLYELQDTVADIIAPFAASPLTNTTTTTTGSDEDSPDQTQGDARGRGDGDGDGRNGGGAGTRLRRSNTMPEGFVQPPNPSIGGTVKTRSNAIKQARRTSSPVLPGTSPQTGVGTTGLGFDYPTIPSLVDTSSSSSSSSLGMAMTLPTLTPGNTASSGLSAIPESPFPAPPPRSSPSASTSVSVSVSTSASISASTSASASAPIEQPSESETHSSGSDRDRERERVRREKEERRASRALRRISASSTRSHSSLYLSNKGGGAVLGRSPDVSIDEVLDGEMGPGMIGAGMRRSPEREVDDMLRKLRAFAGSL